jgi:hypothetical protein
MTPLLYCTVHSHAQLSSLFKVSYFGLVLVSHLDLLVVGNQVCTVDPYLPIWCLVVGNQFTCWASAPLCFACCSVTVAWILAPSLSTIAHSSVRFQMAEWNASAKIRKFLGQSNENNWYNVWKSAGWPNNQSKAAGCPPLLGQRWCGPAAYMRQ